MGIFFLLLLTIVLFGIGKAVISMSFGNKSEKIEQVKMSWLMYFPQIILLVIAFGIGIYFPFSETIEKAVIGF